MKRARGARGDQLTGGTGDVNPQYLSGKITLSAANTATEVTLGTPIVRIGPATKGKVIIMELIKLLVSLPKFDITNAAATDRSQFFSLTTASKGSAVATLDDPKCLAAISRELENAFTAAGTGLIENSQSPAIWDFTDGAGHGVLVATDNLFLQANTTNQAAASTFGFKLTYRFKEVGVDEYIGIVQSQQ